MPNWESKATQWILVILQFTTAAVPVLSTPWPPDSSWPETLIGAALIVAGTLLGLWAWRTIGLTRISVLPAVGHQAALVTDGPYRLMAHPMYVAVVLFCGGFLFLSIDRWRLSAWVILIVVVTIKAKMEERFLASRFAEYPDYRQ